MLASDANYWFKARLARHFLNQWAQLDGFGPGSEDKEDFGQISLFVPVGNSALGEIVGRKFHRHPVSGEYADTVAAQLASQVSQHKALLI